MARQHRSHSVAFKRQVAKEFLAYETLDGLAKRHDLCRDLIRVWVAKCGAGAFEDRRRRPDRDIALISMLRLILDPRHGAAVARRSVRLPAPMERGACAQAGHMQHRLAAQHPSTAARGCRCPRRRPEVDRAERQPGGLPEPVAARFRPRRPRHEPGPRLKHPRFRGAGLASAGPSRQIEFNKSNIRWMSANLSDGQRDANRTRETGNENRFNKLRAGRRGYDSDHASCETWASRAGHDRRPREGAGQRRGMADVRPRLSQLALQPAWRRSRPTMPPSSRRSGRCRPAGSSAGSRPPRCSATACCISPPTTRASSPSMREVRQHPVALRARIRGRASTPCCAAARSTAALR